VSEELTEECWKERIEDHYKVSPFLGVLIDTR